MNLLNNMPVGRKLFTAFACVLVAIIAMGVVVFTQLDAINGAQTQRSTANELGRVAARAELFAAKQENSMRGFLVSGDEFYIARANAHRASFKEQLADLRKLGDAELTASADKTEAAADEWFEKVVVAGHALAKDPATIAQARFMVGRTGSADKFMGGVEDGLAEVEELQKADLEEARVNYDRASAIARWTLIIGIASACLIAFAVGLILTKAIGGPIAAMIRYMDRLRGGDTSIEVSEASRKDEFGQMGVAVLAFRDAAIEKTRVETQAATEREAAEAERARNLSLTEKAQLEQANVVAALGEGLDRLTRGDLTYTLNQHFPDDYVKLQSDFNAAISQLRDAMSVVVTNVSAIRSGSGEISQAADDLSRRTEQQAASLEETAAALDEITATVNKTASGARQASGVVQQARGDAETSGNVVRDAVAAMTAIEQSSSQINQIIGVIDEIAFQTNLLALNAGVEAARAGDAGRGFAVVASEVRALAQRSAEAAKEIKTLISASTTQVDSGVKLVGQTGEALQRIVGRVAEIDGLVSEIAASAQEQATGLQQVNTAVNQMDQVTQQNAAMVEQSTAASHSLSQEAEALQASVSRFNIGHSAAPVAAPRGPAPRSSHTVTALKTVGRGGAALKPHAVASEDGWEEF